MLFVKFGICFAIILDLIKIFKFIYQNNVVNDEIISDKFNFLIYLSI